MPEEQRNNNAERAGRKSKQPRQQQKVSIRQRWKKTALHNKALVVLGAISLGLVAVYTGTVIVQVLLGEKHRSEDRRPFVKFDGFSEELYPSARNGQIERTIAVAGKWLNTGETAATSVIGYFWIDELKDGPPSGTTFIGPKHISRARGYIGPKTGRLMTEVIQKPDTFWTGTPLPPIFTPEIERAMPARSEQIFLWGWIGYEDESAQAHLTEACYRLIGFGSRYIGRTGPLRTLDFKLRQCTEHNCIDRQCADFDQIASLIRPSP